MGVRGPMAHLALIDTDAPLRHVSALLFASAGYEVESLDADSATLATVDWDRIDAVIVGLDPRTEELLAGLQHAGSMRAPVVGLSRAEGEDHILDLRVLLERPVAFEDVLAAVRGLVAETCTAQGEG